MEGESLRGGGRGARDRWGAYGPYGRREEKGMVVGGPDQVREEIDAPAW